MNHERTACTTVIARLLVGLVSILAGTAASPSLSLRDQPQVSAVALPAGQAVGPHQPILAGASRPTGPTYDQSATDAWLADGRNVTGGTAQFQRSPSGRLSHAYDLATNNAAAPWSQPSQATAHDSREPIGSSSVDKAAPSVVALSVAAEDGADGSLNLSTEESWGDLAKIEDHFLRHGPDFSSGSSDEYAQQASQFLQQIDQEGLEVKVAPNGTIRIYDPSTNTFGSFNPDGTTKTFFKPTTGPAYWATQPGVSPWGGP
jgi:hypothetical protein